MIVENEYRIKLSDINRENKATNKAILSYLEDVGGKHSDFAGYGIMDIPQTHLSWILIEWKLQIIRRPNYAENIKVTTIQKNDNTVKDNDSTKDSTKVSSIQSKNDNSLSNKILPKTGMGRATLIIIAFVLIGIAIFLYKKNKYWKDI